MRGRKILIIKDDIRLITIMAGYAKNDVLSSITERWICCLREVSYRLIVVFDQDELSSDSGLCDDESILWICQRHGAYDFGSYQLGLREVEHHNLLQDATHILLCNDSVIGPFSNLSRLLAKMFDNPCPVWGLTESLLYRPHLQSYFLLMECSVIMDNSVRKFFDSVVPQSSRHDVIQQYELGFSALLRDLQYQWSVVCPISEMLDPQNGQPMANATAFPLCLLDAGVPVVKHRALFEPAANQDGLHRTCQVIAGRSPMLWNDLWESSSHHRFWQDQISLSIILQQIDLDHLEKYVQWVKNHHHPKLNLAVTIHERDIKRRGQVKRDFDQDIVSGRLSVLVCSTDVESTSARLQLLAFLGSDWVTRATGEFWSDMAGLQLQLRRVAQSPGQQMVDGSPLLCQREACFSAEAYEALFGERF